MANSKRRPPVHPGRILKSELRESGMSVSSVAEALHIPVNRLSNLIKEKRGMTADTAMRLGRFWGTSAQMWMNLQARYELDVAEEKAAERIDREVQPIRRAS